MDSTSLQLLAGLVAFNAGLLLLSQYIEAKGHNIHKEQKQRLKELEIQVSTHRNKCNVSVQQYKTLYDAISCLHQNERRDIPIVFLLVLMFCIYAFMFFIQSIFNTEFSNLVINSLLWITSVSIFPLTLLIAYQLWSRRKHGLYVGRCIEKTENLFCAVEDALETNKFIDEHGVLIK